MSTVVFAIWIASVALAAVAYLVRDVHRARQQLKAGPAGAFDAVSRKLARRMMIVSAVLALGMIGGAAWYSCSRGEGAKAAPGLMMIVVALVLSVLCARPSWRFIARLLLRLPVVDRNRG